MSGRIFFELFHLGGLIVIDSLEFRYRAKDSGDHINFLNPCLLDALTVGTGTML